MNSTFKSKIGIELTTFLTIILGGISLLFIVKGIWFGLIIIGFVAAFIIQIFSSTTYTICANVLLIKSGFLFNKSIDINSIRKIEETRNPISAPALSLDRLEIFYNKFDSVIISPKDKNKFIEALTQKNMKIEIKRKNRVAQQQN